MLVLACKEGEQVMIGDDIVVTVLYARRKNGVLETRIGFDAPREVPVHREKVYKAIQAEKRRGGAA